ncbi:S8 family peptidase [Saccharomonospora azurea]|uniref:Subtilisin-like serine protease n=1 Tax=Saccharomonospora azurea NA-128 TaxID=882081 RepID=H8GF13_9PSEU|nr:S8 family peptidase [Saccharomonospora azurea]EHY91044.1 subtilisin-like serine protease [Saccharomonospora azurea NA-128]
MGTSKKVTRAALSGAVAVGVTGLFAAGMAPAQAAVGQVVHAGSAQAIDGSYIVVLKDGMSASSVSAQAQTMATEYGTSVQETFDTALNGFTIKADATTAKRLAADDSVAFVSQNQRVQIADAPGTEAVSSWGLDRIDQRDLPLDDSYTPPTSASDVTAYIIDTGVSEHSDFGDRLQPGVDFVDNDDDATDENGHGTHVAGTIGGSTYGVAPDVNLVGVRVLDANGSGTTAGVIAGVEWVAENASGPSVANMSLGGGADEALDEAVRGAIEAGVTFGVAAGNEASDASGSSPARVTEAITVAASDDSDAQASFSNYGDVVDIYAPGVDITSAWHDGSENTISGTSMATPHVVGAAALHLAANPDAAPADVEEALASSATPDVISNPTGETPNRLLYVGE